MPLHHGYYYKKGLAAGLVENLSGTHNLGSLLFAFGLSALRAAGMDGAAVGAAICAAVGAAVDAADGTADNALGGMSYLLPNAPISLAT